MLNFFRPGAKGLDRSGPRLTEPGPGVNPNGFKARGVPLKAGHRGVGHSQWNVFEFYSGATQANFKAPRLSNFRQEALHTNGALVKQFVALIEMHLSGAL